ncbi:MAG: flagellar hook-associated protein FlgK [Oscillospiraceae bacterium]|nr:flagellar hook-associated protein FlgK [Oscillospiraceae bacterium]
MLRSTFAAFTTAQTALGASQRALDVTGQNMANVNTEGYTRQRLDLFSRSANYTSRYTHRNAANVGNGVKFNNVTQIRDPFLDVRFRRENARVGEHASKLNVLKDMELVFDETMNETLATQIKDFVFQLQELSKNAGSDEFEGMLRMSADTLAKSINGAAKQLEAISQHQVFELADVDIPNINGILKSIQALNKNIRENEATGNAALELYDRRNDLIDRLSEYMQISVTYNQIEISKGIFVDDINISLYSDTSPPQLTTLVDNLEIAQFSTKYGPQIRETPQKYTAHAPDQHSIYITYRGQPENITNKITSGYLKGSLDMLNKSGEYDTPPSDFRGVGYYMQSLDNLANMLASVFNTANSFPAGTFPPSDNPNDPRDYRPLFDSADGFSPITAKNFSVASGWDSKQYGITMNKEDIPVGTDANGNPMNTDGAQANITYMISLFESKHSFTNPNGQTIFNGTFQEYFSYVGGVLSLDTQAVGKLYENYVIVADGISEMKEAISGVNMDEEGINLLRFQKSYNAAARLMTTLDEALDTIINRMGLVGR